MYLCVHAWLYCSTKVSVKILALAAEHKAGSPKKKAGARISADGAVAAILKGMLDLISSGCGLRIAVPI